jgi:hypothetical protein
MEKIMRPKPHHVEIDDGDPNEMFVHVTVNSEDGDVIDIIEMFPLAKRDAAYAMAQRLATVFELPLTLIDDYGSEPKPVIVKA